MKYPAITNWVSYSKEENGTYIVYDEAMDDRYRMSSEEFGFFSRLDGRTDPMKIPSEFTRDERQVMLECLEEELLIRRSRILCWSLGSVLVTLFSTENGGASKRRAASAADTALSVLWLPVFVTSVFYFIRHNGAINGPDCFLSGAFFGMAAGMVLHELAHAAACLHYGGKAFEFGVGLQPSPCAYVLLNMSGIKSRGKRAHVNAAGVEANLLLTGTSLYLACLLPGIGSFLFYAALHNLILALFNLIFARDIDGMNIISELIGCDDLFQYAKETINDPIIRQKLWHSGINGLVTLGVCCIVICMQIGLPLTVLFSFALLII